MTQPQDAGSASVAVTDETERSRFEITVDGTFAGFAEYVDDSSDGSGDGDAGVRTFPHTVIEEEFGGRGLSTMLIRTALDATRVAGLAVVPLCSAVRGFIAKHEEYLDLVPQERRAELGL